MARRIQQKSADDLRVGDVTIYGVLLEKRDHPQGGYLMYYPNGPIYIEFHQALPVFCRCPDTMREAIEEALQAQQAEQERARPVVVERTDQLGWL